MHTHGLSKEPASWHPKLKLNLLNSNIQNVNRIIQAGAELCQTQSKFTFFRGVVLTCKVEIYFELN